MFSVDGLTWDIPCDIARVSEVRPSDISGWLLDRTYFNDVLGTYMRYEVTLAVPVDGGARYAAIYERLTEPVQGHDFVFPYNQGTVSFKGRVGEISDVYVRLPNGGIHWKGIRFTVSANEPSKRAALWQALNDAGGADPEDPVEEETTGEAQTTGETQTSGEEETTGEAQGG